MLRPCASVYDLCPFARICFRLRFGSSGTLTIIRQS